MSQLKTYPKYKDSGIEWVGEIPKEWEINKLKRLLEVKNGKEIIDGNLKGKKTFNVYGSGGVFKTTNYFLYDGESVLFGRKGTLGKPMFIKGKFWTVDTMYYTDIYDNAVPKYIYYILTFYPWKLIATKTALPSIVGTDVENSLICIPEKSEQLKIARFLDKKTSEIDALIADKERLIELLEEKRQAVITETVTKGLDPDVKMKDSGIEWIGEIPEHWEVTKIKYQSELNMKSLSDKTNPGQEITYIDIGSVDSNGNIIEKETMKFKEAPSRARRIVKEGDTIVSTVRTYLQAITMIDQTTSGCIVSTGFAVLSPKKSVVDEYFGLYFRSTPVLDRIISISKGINYPAINSSDLAQLEFIYPPYNEQEKIVKRINKKLKEMEIITSKIENQIQKLKEYRESLIYEAVTGKIDVRDYDVERSKCHGH